MPKHFVAKRFPYKNKADPKILGQELHFKTSGQKTKNRFYKASMSELLASFEPNYLKGHGIPTDRHINLYSKWANGGFGLITTGNFVIDHGGMEAPGNVIVSKETMSDEKTGQLQRLAKAAKSNGALVIAQLNHCGRQTPFNINPTPFSASTVQLKMRLKSTFGEPIPLTMNQIKTEVVDRFVFAALQCYECGFDGVEIHAAHGFLLSQFLSPATNLRQDAYGGNADKRSRIIEEVYQAIRAKIPANTGFIIGIKLNSADSKTDTLEDVSFVAKKIDSLGFDYVNLSGGSFENWTMFHYKDSTKAREAFFIEFASAIKPYMKNTVVYVTGGFRSVGAMVQAVKNGDLDGVGIGKPAAAEPDFPLKILDGRVQSASFNHYETDYGIALTQAQTQMGQAGKVPWEKCDGDPCYGITDFSDEQEAKRFGKGSLAFSIKTAKYEKKEGKPYAGVFDYDPRENYDFCGAWLMGVLVGMYSRYLGFKK